LSGADCALERSAHLSGFGFSNLFNFPFALRMAAMSLSLKGKNARDYRKRPQLMPNFH
jgi:hypothetical protein